MNDIVRAVYLAGKSGWSTIESGPGRLAESVAERTRDNYPRSPQQRLAAAHAVLTELADEYDACDILGTGSSRMFTLSPSGDLLALHTQSRSEAEIYCESGTLRARVRIFSSFGVLIVTPETWSVQETVAIVGHDDGPYCAEEWMLDTAVAILLAVGERWSDEIRAFCPSLPDPAEWSWAGESSYSKSHVAPGTDLRNQLNDLARVLRELPCGVRTATFVEDERFRLGRRIGTVVYHAPPRTSTAEIDMDELLATFGAAD